MKSRKIAKRIGRAGQMAREKALASGQALKGPRGWIVVGTLAAYATLGTSQPALAAIGGKAEPGAVGTAATLPLKRFDIAAGPLDGAIAEYEKITGIKVKVVLPSGTLAGFTTQGVHGLYREDEAMQMLLKDTGLNYRTEDATTIAVGVQASDTVSVTASAADSVSMDKFTEPLLETPQSINVVPNFVLQDQGVSTLRDTLRNVPGISLAAGESGAQGDNLTIRGFTARNDIFLDGIRDFGSYYRDAFNYEQVDVLEGPSGVQFGRGSTGGVINQESKVPGASQFVHVDTQFGTDLNRRLTLDANTPLYPEMGGTAFRVNMMGQESGVAGRDGAEIRRFGLAPSVSVGLDDKTHATLSYEHLTADDTPDYGLPWQFNHLSGANRHSYFGFADENYLKTNDDILTLKVQHDFRPGLNIHTTARGANYPRQVQITESQICSNASQSVPVGTVVSALPTLAYNSTIACPYDANTPASEIGVVNRNQIQVKSVETDLWDQTEIAADFKIHGIRNDLVAGVEGGQETSNPIRYSYSQPYTSSSGATGTINSVPYTTLLDPNEAQPFSGNGYISSVVHTKADSTGIYFVDTMKLGHLFELSGGARWDYFNADYHVYTPVVPTSSAPAAFVSLSRLDKQPTYRAAFVYKPSSHGSVYFDWGTSFDPDAESLSLSAGLVNGNVKPEENETYEGGAKWSFLNERLMMEGAVFRTEKDNAHETDPTNSNDIVAAGNQLVKGVQLSVVGRLPEGMDLVAGYAYLDSDVIYSQFFPAAVGYPLANVPKQTFNLFVTHRLPWRLDGGLGGNYVGGRTASSTVPYVPTSYAPNPNGAGYIVTSVAMKQVPGYWIFNAMLKRSLGEKFDFQVNVNNLLNRYYIDLPHPSHLIPGAGANAQFGLNFKF
ncbi:TonB-dependent receptor domain-containing protein [Acidicapsa dinghuensis]|uniref:TonB-dependent receptor domain-containing protein n=1 Tax=Acidicapsa dinghuensis TaxID=2218256 RepID=A0ABW1EF15_9BACT|nr:TonB-dependent siderophore receptor [Acidicapsa dinghuensis]